MIISSSSGPIQNVFKRFLCTDWSVLLQFNFAAEDDRRDRTVRFSADNACMDVTQSHTVSIATDFAAHDVFAESCDVKKGDRTLGQGNKAMRSSNYKGMETSKNWIFCPKCKTKYKEE